jgi:hypothetical protein
MGATVSRVVGDEVAVAAALSHLHDCLLDPEHSEVRLRVADSLIATSVRTGRRIDLLMGVLWRSVDTVLAEWEDAVETKASVPAVARCARHGVRWRLQLGNRHTHVDDCVGMAYLAILIANPGREIEAKELAAGPGSGATPSTNDTAQPLLDRDAIAAYRRRLADLRVEMERCDVIGDQARAIQLYEEQNWLLGQLRAAAGFDRRVRSFATADEKARIAVGKAIRRALDRVSAADASIGEHLSTTVRTGRRCSYLPGPHAVSA